MTLHSWALYFCPVPPTKPSRYVLSAPRCLAANSSHTSTTATASATRAFGNPSPHYLRRPPPCHRSTGTPPPMRRGAARGSQVWRTHGGECVHTFDKHTDYVQALAPAPAAHRFASVGLGGEVLLWDLTGGNQPSGREPPLVAEGHKESVYSVAIDPHATVLVSAGTEYGIRVWDPRSGEKKCKLKVCAFPWAHVVNRTESSLLHLFVPCGIRMGRGACSCVFFIRE